jgi:hypothetical protein
MEKWDELSTAGETEIGILSSVFLEKNSFSYDRAVHSTGKLIAMVRFIRDFV